MSRSLFPTLRAGLSRLNLHRGIPAAEAVPGWLPEEKRVAERRRHISDFRYREFRLQAIAQVTETGVYDFEFTTGTNYWSPELKAIAGLPEDAGELSLEQMLQIGHPEDRERFTQQVEASLDPLGSGHFEDEYRFVRPDGSCRWVKVRGRTFFAGHGDERRVLGASGIVMDITEQKRTEELLRESEGRYRTLFANMTEGFALGEPILDEQGRPVSYRYLVVNEAFYVQTGIPRGIQGLPIRDYLPQLEQYWIDRYCAVALTGKPDRVDAYNADTRRHYDVYVFSPSPGKFAILFRDITERKHTEQALTDSERRLAVALEASAAAVWELDVPTGTVRGEDLLFTGLGYAPGELMTRADWRALFHRDDQEAASEKLEEVIQGKRDRCHVELRVRAKDGNWRWMLTHAAAAERDAAGRALRVIGTLTDVSERKAMEEAVRQDRSRLQSILDNAPLLVSIKDLEGRMALANRAFYELLEVPPPEQLIGRTVFEIFPPELAKCLWGSDQLALAADGQIRSEGNIRHRDGSWHDYLTVRFPVKDIHTGQARSLCAIAIDITDRKAAEAQIQALNAELEARVLERTAQLQESNEALLQSNADLKHFAHATAHDLQTPLRSIAGFTQLLQKEIQGRVNERVDEWSTAVVENTKRLQVLIQEILSYTRLELEGQPFEMVDLQRLFDEAVSSLAVLMGETRAEVTSSALPTLLVDRTQIALVFQNLIENGIKYNRSKPPRVAVSGDFQEDQWVFSVADNGIGIDPKHYDRVFELFRRLHPYHQIPGAGIGLPLCRRIVERHGGRIWVESRPGEGSTFYFSLPAPSHPLNGDFHG